MHATPTKLPISRALILVAVALLAAGLVAIAAAPAGAAVKRGPDGGGFYQAPKKLPNGHGKAIWQRQAKKLTPIANAGINKTLLYTSRSPQGDQVVVSGSVSVPKGKAPAGGWPVISWAHGTTGAADSCAPTRIRPSSPAAPYVAYVHPQLEDWIKAGYAVVATDYQGLGTPGPHPYLVDKAEGRSVVDIVSAARQLVPSLSRKYLIAGHSQGGQSALFAASLASQWAPDLKLKGTVAFAPASHLLEQAKLLPSLTTPSGLSALAALILKGASTVSKDVKANKLLTPDARALFPETEQVCLPQLAESDSFGGIAPADLLQKNADTSDALRRARRHEPGGEDRPRGAPRPGHRRHDGLPVLHRSAQRRARRPRRRRRLQDLPRRQPRRDRRRGRGRRARLLRAAAAVEVAPGLSPSRAG